MRALNVRAPIATPSKRDFWIFCDGEAELPLAANLKPSETFTINPKHQNKGFVRSCHTGKDTTTLCLYFEHKLPQMISRQRLGSRRRTGSQAARGNPEQQYLAMLYDSGRPSRWLCVLAFSSFAIRTPALTSRPGTAVSS